MAEVVKVEFVCTGNIGRSPLCEAVAREWLRGCSRYSEDTVRITSSGTDVLNTVDWQRRSPGYNLIWLRKGLQYSKGVPSFYTPDQQAFVEQILHPKTEYMRRFDADPAFKAIVQNLSADTRRRLETVEREHRNRYFREHGLPIPKEDSKPFKAMVDLTWVVGMQALHTEYIRTAYGTVDRIPAVVEITKFAGIKTDVSGVFGSPDPQAYCATYERLAVLSVIIMDKLLNGAAVGK